MTTTRKYYVMIPSAFSHSGEPYWHELLTVKSLTSAQSYVDHFFGGLTEAEIWVSINDEDKTLTSTKDKEGKWEVVCNCKSDDRFKNDQIQYHHNGKLVSKEDFYKYGFQHEKLEKTKKQTDCCTKH